MNLRWRSPAAVMHRDFIILFNSNSTITAGFELEIQNIEIVLFAPSNGSQCTFELISSAPVTTDITVTQWIHYREENICEGTVDYETDMLIEVTISKGQTYASTSISTGNDSCTSTSIYAEKSPVMEWEGKTINGAKYQFDSSTGWF